MNTVDQLMNAKEADYTEIFNSVSDFPANCRPYSGDVIDKCAARGLIFPMAGVDDSHWYKTEFARSFIYLFAEECSPEAVKDALFRRQLLRITRAETECVPCGRQNNCRLSQRRRH